MNLFFLIISLFLQTQATSQVEFNAGSGVHKKEPASIIEIGFDASSDQISTGIVIPFMLTLHNKLPAVEERLWDEPTDFAHVLRYLTWRGRSKNIKAGFRIGEKIDLSLNEGSLVWGLNYMILMDHPHTGAQFGIEHENFKSMGFIDDFVDPSSGGLSFVILPKSYLRFGASMFSDMKIPNTILNNRGTVTTDNKLGTIYPFTSSGFVASSLFGGITFFDKIDFDFAVSSTDIPDLDAIGGHGSLKLRFKSENIKGWGKFLYGAGKKHYLPWIAGPLYMIRRFCMDPGDASCNSTLYRSVKNNRGVSQGMGLEVSFNYKSLFSITGSWRRSLIGDLLSVSTELIISKKFVTAFYGIYDFENTFIFSSEGRFALTDNWYIWGRGKRLFAISNAKDYYSPQFQFLAGIGYREQPENSD